MIVIILYSLMILLFIVGLIRLPKTEVDQSLHQQRFSILIPFRNEEKSLNNLLKSIQNLEYDSDNFEILLIDDESTDNSVNIIKQWQDKIPNIKILNNQRVSYSPKKDAIQVGIKATKFDFIITTDADCVLPKNWLYAYNSIIYQKQSLFVAGPIALKTNKNFVEQYQKYDSLSLISVTMGSFGIQQPMMCNAANMGFDKKAYLQMQSHQTNIASGDDVFTLENFVKDFPKKVHYLNTTEALVVTKAENNWKKVIQQRIRWAAKSTHYKSFFTKFIGLIVLITQLFIVFGLMLKPLFTFYLLLLKIGIDLIIILITNKKLKQKISIQQYVLVGILYPFLNTYIGIKALFGGYNWKGRKFKR
ncbi:glycosyltransferase [Wenyingzhuangia sp. chi5]|uniref:Glycosyltransferase n=1 Tax=Wenyingzhuangia gilva TaxID=3057677 RepID=A0ABT8VN66_9FLAO|nr:glycosyltransferase [Wenyingzhuangia sp. chi5]MDO3693406.1 glycosyltransferase [Wenyingzhuangia sp. chi5]